MARKNNPELPYFDTLEDMIEYEKSLPEGTDLMNTKVLMRIDRAGKGDESFEYVALNDIRLQIPRKGQVEAVPLPHAELLMQKYEAEIACQEFIETIPNEG